LSDIKSNYIEHLSVNDNAGAITITWPLKIKVIFESVFSKEHEQKNSIINIWFDNHISILWSIW